VTVAGRLAELGLVLPPVPAPAGAYVPAVRSGSLVFTAGQLPLAGGVLVATGRLGAEIDPVQGRELARICVLNALAAVNSVAELDAVTRVVKLMGFVASAPGFTAQPAVLNGASELLGEIFGDTGVHARSAVGVAELPMGSPVELEMIVELSR
jgi:enamine deaminase RidA (YjgF/YER057c/UK114 family)